MLKLLRTIRRKILEKGKVKTYFLYVIGEVLLVVVGILLALQINNWNQGRLDRNSELSALQDLHGEFLINAQKIGVKQTRRVLMLEPLMNYVDLMANDEISYADHIATFSNGFGTGYLSPGFANPSMGVLKSLISTGDIDLISNDTLKYLLTDWEEQLGNLSENERAQWDFAQQLHNYSKKYIPVVVRGDWVGWPDDRMEQYFKELIQDIEYRNNVLDVEKSLRDTINVCDSILKKLNDIILFLEKEMG